jgi:5-methylcytosine-specific restriction endonuclease McrA
MKFICPICNKEFRRAPSAARRKGRSGIMYCSKECFDKWQIRNQVIVNCDNCGENIILKTKQNKRNIHHFCNKTCEMEWRRGENHPRYHGGYHRTYGRGWKKQRKLTLERDKVCKNCGVDRDLDTHHIIPFQLSKDNSLSNLIVLCKSCHSSIGNTYWKVENRPQYFEIINSMRL